MPHHTHLQALAPLARASFQDPTSSPLLILLVPASSLLCSSRSSASLLVRAGGVGWLAIKMTAEEVCSAANFAAHMGLVRPPAFKHSSLSRGHSGDSQKLRKECSPFPEAPAGVLSTSFSCLFGPPFPESTAATQDLLMSSAALGTEQNAQQTKAS